LHGYLANSGVQYTMTVLLATSGDQWVAKAVFSSLL
jgi:hypothetical protein